MSFIEANEPSGPKSATAEVLTSTARKSFTKDSGSTIFLKGKAGRFTPTALTTPVISRTANKHGKGLTMLPDGSVHTGSYNNDLFEGHGTYVWPNLNSYEGEFSRGNINGLGVFCWTDGRIYEGQFLNSSRHGKGTYKWPDGRSYKGDWKNGKQDGIGIFTAKGKQRTAECRQGQKVRWID